MDTRTKNDYQPHVPGHNRRLYTDEELAAMVKREVPECCNARLIIAERRAMKSGGLFRTR